MSAKNAINHAQKSLGDFRLDILVIFKMVNFFVLSYSFKENS